MAIKRVILICCVWTMTSEIVVAQNPEHELGNWLIYNGTIQFSERWSLFTEAQLRLWEIGSNVNDVLLRAGGQYHTSPNTLVALGYLHSKVRVFEDGPDTTENRIYEQFTGKHRWGRPLLEHRFRLEQRWLETSGDTIYRNRARYRLQITTPLNRPTMQPRTHFVNIYDEVMLNFANSHDNGFDQNRLYAAYGYQFTKLANLQLGLLWQAKPSQDFFRLQIFYTHNFDLTDH